MPAGPIAERPIVLICAGPSETNPNWPRRLSKAILARRPRPAIVTRRDFLDDPAGQRGAALEDLAGLHGARRPQALVVTGTTLGLRIAG
jgi:hypothetical protein